MTRVSQNSGQTALAFALSKAKSRMEELQMKGATLRNITKPSDNPAANAEAMSIENQNTDKKQYMKNIDQASLFLSVTEKSLEQLTEIMIKAKEIAIAQASDFYNPESRKNVSQEVKQLKNHAISLGNKRVGNRFLFSGYKTLTAPFDNTGSYKGDEGRINIEVSKDYFVPINLHGREVFFTDAYPYQKDHPLENFNELKRVPEPPKAEGDIKEKESSEDTLSREIASTNQSEKVEAGYQTRANIFSLLEVLSTALETNDAPLIQNSIEEFDKAIDRLVNMRTRIGAVTTSLEHKSAELESNLIDNEDRKSKLVDADVVELFSDITKQQNILKATYQSSKDVMNNSLLDFLK
jgi:flagellar hook-associated protein 3 FlgL